MIFNLHKEEIFSLENYFYSNIAPIFFATKLDILLQIAHYQVLYKNEYAYIRSGTPRLLFFLQNIRKLTKLLKEEHLPLLLYAWVEKIDAISNQKDIKQALDKFASNKLSFVAIIEYNR